MKSRCLLGCLLLAAGVASAAEPNTLTAEERAAGWSLLFDGESMAGWRQESPPRDSWAVEDGCLKTIPRAHIREDLVSAEEFGDFELTFEWRIAEGGNSGVKYRIQDEVVLQAGRLNPDSRRFEDQVAYELANRRGVRSEFDPAGGGDVYMIGFEYQIIDNARHPDARRGANHTTGAIYDVVAPSSDATRPVGEFNQSRIVLRGDHVEHWLNGVKVVEFDLEPAAVGERIARRWGPESHVYQLLTTQPKRRCPISLQYHGDAVWFRSIKIRRADPLARSRPPGWLFLDSLDMIRYSHE